MSRSRAIESRLEKLIPSMEELLVAGAFTREELRQIAKMRTAHEYRLVARPLLLLDIREAINYELQLEKRISEFVSSSGLQLKHRWAVRDRVERIYAISLNSLRSPVERRALRAEYIEFLKKFHRTAKLSKFYAFYIQKFPMNVEYWLEGATWELEMDRIENARKIVQEALALMPSEAELWVCAFHIELEFARSLIRLIIKEPIEGDAEHQREEQGPQQQSERSDVQKTEGQRSKLDMLRRENPELAHIVGDLSLATLVAINALQSEAFSWQLVKSLWNMCLKFVFTADLASQVLRSAMEILIQRRLFAECLECLILYVFRNAVFATSQVATVQEALQLPKLKRERPAWNRRIKSSLIQARIHAAVRMVIRLSPRSGCEESLRWAIRTAAAAFLVSSLTVEQKIAADELRPLGLALLNADEADSSQMEDDSSVCEEFALLFADADCLSDAIGNMHGISGRRSACARTLEPIVSRDVVAHFVQSGDSMSVAEAEYLLASLLSSEDMPVDSDALRNLDDCVQREKFQKNSAVWKLIVGAWILHHRADRHRETAHEPRSKKRRKETSKDITEPSASGSSVEPLIKSLRWICALSHSTLRTERQQLDRQNGATSIAATAISVLLPEGSGQHLPQSIPELDLVSDTIRTAFSVQLALPEEAQHEILKIVDIVYSAPPFSAKFINDVFVPFFENVVVNHAKCREAFEQLVSPSFVHIHEVSDAPALQPRMRVGTSKKLATDAAAVDRWIQYVSFERRIGNFVTALDVSRRAARELKTPKLFAERLAAVANPLHT